MSVARATGVGFRYSGADSDALVDVDLELAAGELVLVRGPSGSGKSTLLRVLTGAIPHLHGGRFRGRCVVGGLDTRTTAPAAIAARAGLGFQDPEAQAVMRTVARDVAFGPECLGRSPEQIAADVGWALRAAGAERLASRELQGLSSGERQRASLASVLALRTPLVLLDEPLSQLDSRGAQALVASLAAIAERGICVVVAEHREDRVAAVADRCIAVADGRIADAMPDDRPGLGDPLGRERSGVERLRLERVSVGRGGREVLRDVSLTLERGSVAALTGDNGAGKSTLLRAIAGLERPSAGRILLVGRDITAIPIEQRFPGIAFLAQDPGRHLICERVRDELAYALVQLGLPRRERALRVQEQLRTSDLEHLADRHPLDLSVGERERVALAAAMVARPDLLLLDEPTRGMDPARKRSLAEHLDALAAVGSTVVVATHDERFAATCADSWLEVASGGVRQRPGPSEAAPTPVLAT